MTGTKADTGTSAGTSTGPSTGPSAVPGALRGPLALSRGTIDRAANRRTDAGWLDRAWRDPRTRVLVVDAGRALVRWTAGRAELALLPAGQAPPGERYFLGVDPGPGTDGPEASGGPGGPERPEANGGPGGTAYFAVRAALPTIAGTEPAGLRAVGTVLDDRDAGLLTHAVALANWHAAHQHCARCGCRTEVATAGHTRVCPADASEHFPRVDPAVIMLVQDRAGRCLLARHPDWGAGRLSVLAGFVEPGESLEQAVIREVAEEVGITVGSVRYLGSQPWPLPQSLMLGFCAVAEGDQPLRPDGEEIAEARWYSRAELRAALDAGTVRLSPPVSIAHRLIVTWYGEELPGSW